jgi:predicted ATPase
LAHPPSLAFHLSLRAELYFWHRDAERLRNVGDRLLALADAEGFELFASTARWYRGWARACLEDLPGGISDAAQAWKMYAKTGAVVNIGHGHCELAELLLRAGRLDEALSVLDTAERSSRDLGGEKVCDAELHRVRGETMAQRGATARGQGAKALEVRAAASLARLSERVSSPAEDQMSSDAVIEGRLGTT